VWLIEVKMLFLLLLGLGLISPTLRAGSWRIDFSLSDIREQSSGSHGNILIGIHYYSKTSISYFKKN